MDKLVVVVIFLYHPNTSKRVTTSSNRVQTSSNIGQLVILKCKKKTCLTGGLHIIHFFIPPHKKCS